MRKLLSVVLALCLVLCTVVPAFAADNTDVVIDGTWKLLVADYDTEQANYAVQKIQSVLSESLGQTLPIVSSASEKFIAVGAAADCDISGIADNGCRITVKNGNVHINGTGSRGVVVGAYRFAEKFAGRKVYTSTLTVLPKTDAITVPANTDDIYEPYFEYTDTDWISPTDPEYSLANGLNGGPYRRLTAAQGGTVNYISGFCHTLATQFCSPDKYFASHPEYFAYRKDKGERVTRQLCLTNPEVLEIVKQEVLDLLAAKHDPSASLQIVSLTQNDNYDYCECENCKAFEKAHGDVRSTTMINFVNQVADVVAAEGYDNVAIDTFAYQYTRRAPTGIAPRDNIIVRLCTIECCFSHALDDPSCNRNTALMKDLADWSKICGRIYVWDYTTNYAHTVCIFPDLGVIQANAQVFYEHNVKGVYEEGAYYAKNCNAEFVELRSYMIAKCLQDPYCDLDEEINGFLQAYYGDGANYMREIIDIFTRSAGDKTGHLGIYQSSADSLTLNNYQITQIDKAFEAAKAAAATEEQFANTEKTEMSWKYWKASANRGEFSLTNPNRFQEKQKLYDLLIKYDIHMLNEGGEYDDFRDCISVRNTKPDDWHMYEAGEPGAIIRNFFSRILENLMPFLTGLGALYNIYKIVSGVNFPGKGIRC